MKNTRNLKVGDRVRVIPSSYFMLSKNFFLYREVWQTSKGSKDKKIMLGGEYKILRIIDNHARLLNYNVNNVGMEIISDLVNAKDIINCPYSVGDMVIFSPKCSEAEIKFLLIGGSYNLLDKNKKFEIKAILNNYYIFLNYNMDDNRAFPFRWEDFKKVDSEYRGISGVSINASKLSPK